MKQIIIYTFIIVLILGAAVWWQIFRYGECKKVGHSTLYCVLNIGGK